ncbi:hypothetical protein [Streptomyces sp. SPB074]|uniref:hypothetical protein n=1 Tax=Streptomyces sp. (strain SPB074) TaxID=465543 RepID=UPI00017F0E73|nr:hypothetical protein [Streptomyces sp. SPB074]
MKITLNLPEVTIDPTDDGGRDERGAPVGLPDCPHCHAEHDGRMAKTVDGLVHERCVDAWLSRRDERDAWKVVAAHVGRYPSRQSASAIRATINALLAMQPRPTEETS